MDAKSTNLHLTEQTTVCICAMEQLFTIASSVLQNVIPITLQTFITLKGEFSHRQMFRVRPRRRFLLFLILLEAIYILFSTILTGNVFQQTSPVLVKVRDSSHENIDHAHHLYVEHLIRFGKPPTAIRQKEHPPNMRPIVASAKTHINPHDFELIQDEPRVCFDHMGSPKDVFLVVLITTIHENVEKRQTIRETWGSPKEVLGKKIITLFLLASQRRNYLQRRVEKESRTHHDLLQEDFTDSYKNLTLKTVMALKWTTTHCSHASYVMKTDDDMYVSYHNLVKFLAGDTTPSYGLAFGFRIQASPIRDPTSKWYMPRRLYPDNFYPPFLSGTGYVLSTDVAMQVYYKSLDAHFLYLEDVFVATCLDSLDINPVHNGDFYNWRTEFHHNSCRFHDLITLHMVTSSEMYMYWNDHQKIRQYSKKCQW